MALPRTFSRRKREAAAGPRDVYIYDAFSNKVRVQIVQILMEGFGEYGDYNTNASWWNAIVVELRKDKGVFHLTDGYEQLDLEFCNWLLKEQDIDVLLDGIESAIQYLLAFRRGQKSNGADKVAEINARLQEAAVGYEFASNQLIRIDNLVVHTSVVVPALVLLSSPEFSSADKEYLDAHAAFRAGDYESSLVDCAKAFESVLKVIGEARGWAIGSNDTASKLVGAAFAHDFVPQYMQSQFTALRSMLESGVATIRNRMGAHGAGPKARAVDKHLAAYQLHQTAAAIVFLVEQHNSLPQ
ncbi:hypothetical protein C8J45_103300 [Sphingomonas sp. PP-CE-3G-477]|nr:hypothetical protein C8J45_103300 [Sphingomonas sp. PP-CE-3G-477]